MKKNLLLAIILSYIFSLIAIAEEIPQVLTQNADVYEKASFEKYDLSSKDEDEDYDEDEEDEEEDDEEK